MKASEEVRSQVDIVKLVGDYVKLRKAGANYVGLCPFHHEKTPSFAVHPLKQIFHCFGCGVGGDVFKFVMLIENVTFPEALERLAEKVGVKLSGRTGFGFDDARAKERAVLHQMHEFAEQFFAAQLGGTMEGRAAKGYLMDRGLGDETLALFRLGYAPSDGQTLALRLAEAGFPAELMETSGLVAPGREGQKPFDRFRRRVIFPIENESGKVIAFAGRALGDEQPKYLNSPETPIYTKSRILYHLHKAGPAIRKQDAAILVEGYMDCIALASSGIENVVASCGTSLTESQVRLLGRYTRRVVVSYDADSAGIAATERSLGMLLEEGFEVHVLILPGGLDPDSFIRQQGVGSYRELLARAPAYLDYLTDRAAAAHDQNTPEGKVRAANAVLPYLAKVGNPLLRDEMASRIAERLRLDERLLRDELKRAAHTGGREIPVKQEAAVLKVSLTEKELLQAFLQSPELALEFLPALVSESHFEDLPAANLFKRLFAEYNEFGHVDLGRLENSISPDECRYLFEIQFAGDRPPDREQVLSCCKALQRQKLERERASLQVAIERAEREQDRGTLNRLLETKLQVMKSLAQTRQA